MMQGVRGHGARRNWKPQDRSAGKKDEKQEEKVREPFMLQANCSTATFCNWWDAMHGWASTTVHRHQWHRVWDRVNPGARPEAVQPDVPNPDNFQFEHEFDAASKVYVSRMNRFDRVADEIRMDGILMFNKMKNHLSVKVLRGVEDRYEQAAFEGEDPIILLDALKVVELNQAQGQLGNIVDSGKAKKKFMAILQRHGQPMQEFYEFYQQEFDALIQSEVADGRSREEVMEADWPEQNRIKNFLSCLSTKQVGDWLDEIRFENKEIPDTLEEVFKEAVRQAKKSIEKQRRDYGGAEMLNIYHVSQNRGNNGGRGNNANRGQTGVSGRGGGSRKIPAPGKRRMPVLDNEGQNICFDYMDGKCPYGSNCRWSHNAPARESGTGKGAAVDQDVVNAIAKLHGGKKTGSVNFANAKGTVAASQRQKEESQEGP